jgi:TATA-binding protein-associated factor
MCDLSPLQQRLYNDFAAKHKAGEMVKDALSSAAQAEGKGAAKEAKAKEGGRATEAEGGAATGGAATHIFQALQYLRKLSNHPKLVLSPLHPEMANVNKMLKNEGLTLDDISLAPKLLALRQILWDCGIGNEVVKKEEAEEEAEEVGDSAGRHRVLVFAQMKSMLDIIEHDLFKKEMPDVTYLRMDGSTPNARRFEMQQQFNGDPSLDVLLLTTHVGGLGLNLTGADTVVFVEHDWNPMRDLQAMDRAHRIGQKKVVNVYRLITKNTLEEKIMGLQRFKLRYRALTKAWHSTSAFDHGAPALQAQVPQPHRLSLPTSLRHLTYHKSSETFGSTSRLKRRLFKSCFSLRAASLLRALSERCTLG